MVCHVGIGIISTVTYLSLYVVSSSFRFYLSLQLRAECCRNVRCRDLTWQEDVVWCALFVCMVCVFCVW